MSRLVESIKIQDGKICNLKFSNLRFNNARRQVFGVETEINLADKINIPDSYKQGIVKCRILYGASIDAVEFEHYRVKYIQSLRIVHDDTADYTYKWADRGWLNELLKQKGNCDDILIVKDGFVTDTSHTNIIFYDGENWVTPATFLLNGTQRQKLLSEGKISEKEIKTKDIFNYPKARAINAFFDLDFGVDIPVENIIPRY